MRKPTEPERIEPILCPIDQFNNSCDPVSCFTQRHANEIETLLSIQQAITSQLNLNDVLQMIADEARRLTSAKISFLYVLDDDFLSLAAVSGVKRDDKLHNLRVPVAQSIAGESILTHRSIMIDDVEENDARIYKEAIKPFGKISCYLTVPLIYRDHSIGVIAVADQCNTQLGDDSLRILSMLAPSAVIGIENARMYQEQQERRIEAESRHQMSESMRVMLAILNSNRSLPDILKYIVTHVSSRLLECQGTAIFTVQPKDHSLIIQAAHGLPFDLVDAQFLPGYDTAKKVVRTGLPMTVTSAHTGGADDDANFDAISVEWAMVNQMIVNYQSWMAVPLVIKGETYGAILMYYSDPHEFTSEEINLALMFSDQVALAIENARLRSEAEKAAVIAERNRLARELHDAVSQTLFSANIIAEVLPRLWDRNQPEARKRLLELQQLTHGALAEMRTLLYELRPSVFKEAKLGELLKQLIQGISVRAQIPIDLVVEGDGLLPAEVQIVFYRITQEALNNVIKHANPNHVEVKLQYYPESVSLTISDDGCGFDPEQVSPEHFGLSIMQERATTINAKLKLSSQPGKGTQVMVTWIQAPLKEKV
jgi:signal transduction histidine kinase/putative methionine-R-sulfoxide reductase with GAF domain